MGMLLSLAVMFVFYLFIIVADALDSSPALHPWLFPWFAIIGFQITALLLFRRAD
jgi:quinol-cytochrome oxidoreductase complex cytochrome b subunit